MLGVTAFGIFLTPVFFNVIDAAGSARFFRSRFWQWTQYLTLGIFGLGFLKAGIRYAWERRRGKIAPVEEQVEEIPDDESALASEPVADLETAGKE